MKKTNINTMDFQELYSEFGDLGNDQLDFNDPSIEDITQRGSHKPLEGLINVDYSLNSPLLSDEVEEFLAYTRGRPYKTLWNHKLWSHRRFAMIHFKIDPYTIRPPSEFHPTFFTYLRQWKSRTHRFETLLENANTAHKLTWKIPESFFNVWLDKSIEAKDMNRVSNETKHYGAIWLDLHYLTLLLNASSTTELKELCRSLNGTYHDFTQFSASRISLPNLGSCFIFNGFVYISSLKLLVDRNMLLMMKDVTNSRLHCLMSLQNRQDSKYTSESCATLARIYGIGDKIIARNGNLGYDAIKMVEPLCNLRFTELAQKERPKIPLNIEFGDFIRTSIENSGINREGLTELYHAIGAVTNVNLLLAIYGSYRHWGHPFLEYLEGLKKLREQTNLRKDIDQKYAEKLASDLAMLVCKDQFTKNKKWPVDSTKVPKKHKLYECITANTWPTPFLIRDTGDTWHELPLKQCFDIPDVVDPSLIYSDKSHSLNRSEIIDHLTRFPNKPIPSKKVLDTFIKTPATNWKEFLQEINDRGLDLEYLVIGLRGKEREIKRIGRFFALMSWKLRDYFVITEYLIKLHFVPLFSGLTMADDLNTVIKKMLDTSNGQGLGSYEYITLANHIDYEKWNNHQRAESNNPVFRVMGQFLGYPNLITRTHEFFQKSLIYYNNRPDLMFVQNGVVLNKNSETPVCWNGQDGGLEGLRQKGWSITNLLVIKREGRVENTRISILAQGDNQVICTQYKLQKVRSEEELAECITKVLSNNDRIMKNVRSGTERLGLIINESETITSADYLNYGKVPIYRGKIMGLETKRWSRITCVSNDQLPTIGNIMSTVSSNALSVSYFSESPINSISYYNFIGNFAIEVLSIHNPATKCAVTKLLNKKESDAYHGVRFRVLLLYLDPSLGGICGVSLTRFLIRGFPDPVTEGLSFWKGIYNSSDLSIRNLIQSIGNPTLNHYSRGSFPKLVENPLSLNLRHGVNPVQVIKDEIKQGLIRDCDRIQNHIVKHAVMHSRDEEEPLYAFLETIKPRFPRFLSEYKSSTYLGMTDGLVGLFQNSKTVRNIFSARMKRSIDRIIIESEIQGVRSLLRIVMTSNSSFPSCWTCSSQQADLLRTLSWGGPIVGATIPHPFEMMRVIRPASICDHGSVTDRWKDVFLSVIIPTGIPEIDGDKGPYKAYLGSKTKESTSLLRPWENESKIPLIRRAADLRKSFGWFVNPRSMLGQSIQLNLQALTGIDWGLDSEQQLRSGSALHRFSCSRQSQGGYIAQSPLFGTWMLETTDTMSDLGSTNYDFLYQAQLLYSQMTTGEYHRGKETSALYHYHIDCTSCLREITEVNLESGFIYYHPDVSYVLNSWKPSGSEWITKKAKLDLRQGNWEKLSLREKSFHIGKMQGFLYGEITYRYRNCKEDSSLFPLVLRDKLDPKSYMKGIVYGLIHASAIAALYRRTIQNLRRPDALLLGQVLFLIDNISRNEGLVNVWRETRFLQEFITVPHKIPPSYPLNNQDLGELGKNYLRSLFTSFKKLFASLPKTYEYTWIFGDFMDSDFIIPYVIAQDAVRLLYFNKVTPALIPRLRELKELLGEEDVGVLNVRMNDIIKLRRVQTVNQELRHALKNIDRRPDTSLIEVSLQESGWGPEYIGHVIDIPVAYESESQSIVHFPVIHQIQDPLISGLRLFQCPTGAHYKLRTILERFKINFQDALVGGDGSGGMTSCVLRLNPITRAIFNSLLDLTGVELKGSAPSPPSAIACIPEICSRCVNYLNAWENPTDLRKEETWQYFVKLKRDHHLTIDLMVFDVETKTESDLLAIEHLLCKYLNKLISPNGTLIFKTHVYRLLKTWTKGILTEIGCCFKKVSIVLTTMSSSSTSEVYVVMRRPSEANIRCKPVIESLLHNLHLIPSQRDPLREFKRALAIPVSSMYQGVPKNLISDPYTDLCVMMLSLGVESGTAALISELWRLSEPRQKEILPFYTLFMIINSMLQLTRGSKDFSISQDRVIYNLGGFLVGFLNWLAWATKNYHIKLVAQKYLDQCFLFSWTTFKTKKDLIMKKVSFLGKYSNEKNVYLDSKSALIGSVIRIFTRLSDRRYTPKIKVDAIDYLMKNENVGYNINFIRRTTDIFEILSDRPSVPPTRTPFVGVSTFQGGDSAWTGDQI